MPVTRSGKLSSGELKSKAQAGLDRGLILSANLVAQRATRRAPIDTGRLKRSITAGRPYSGPGGRRAINIGTNVEYAKAQEFGLKPPPVFMRAQPYMRPAIKESRADVKRIVGNSVLGAITA